MVVPKVVWHVHTVVSTLNFNGFLLFQITASDKIYGLRTANSPVSQSLKQRLSTSGFLDNSFAFSQFNLPNAPQGNSLNLIRVC